jgi:hypothetical protein
LRIGKSGREEISENQRNPWIRKFVNYDPQIPQMSTDYFLRMDQSEKEEICENQSNPWMRKFVNYDPQIPQMSTDFF